MRARAFGAAASVMLVLVVAGSGCDGGDEGEPEPGPSPRPRPAPPGPPPPELASPCESVEKAARRRIAYVRDEAIWTSRLDGGDARRVTRRAFGTGSPAFEPGGRRIAFKSDRDGGGAPEVLTVGSSGRGQRVLERDLGPDPSGPAWSPDGRRIAFTDNAFLTVIDAAGGPRTRLLPEMYVRAPAWSPDGRWIVFGGGRRSETPTGGRSPDGLWMVRADGTRLRYLTDTPGVTESGPAWSPDGRAIAYYNEGPDQGIWTIRSDGRGRRRLTRGDDYEPTWGSDCRTIAFVRSQGAAYSLRTVSLDGRRRTLRRGLHSYPLGDWSRPTLAERGPARPIEPPPAGEPRPLVVQTREELLIRAGDVCRELAGSLRELEQPRDLEDLRRYVTRAGVPLAKAATELSELQASTGSTTFEELVKFWYLQANVLEEIATLLNYGDHPGGGLMASDANTRNPPPRAAFVLSDCRDTVLPRLVPGVKRLP